MAFEQSAKHMFKSVLEIRTMGDITESSAGVNGANRYANDMCAPIVNGCSMA